MKRELAARLLSELAGMRALCVGDILLDFFVYGDIDRISREAPVPILSETRRVAMLGGAGNLARNIASLGGQPTIAGAIGDDPEGETVGALLKDCAGGGARPVVESARLTPTKIRYVANNQQMLCVDRDPAGSIGEETEDAVLAVIEAALAETDVLVLSDYGRGVITPRLSRAVIDKARAAGVPVCVDPRGSDYTRYDGARVIKPNAEELAVESGLPVNSDAEAEAALAALKARLPETDALLVTRGAAGMSLLGPDGAVAHHRSRPRSVFDVSGAGDTALAALALGVAARLDLAEAMALADLAAGAAVAKAGTATVSPEEVLQNAEDGSEAPDWRVISRETAASLSETWRRDGLRVGFTNGCFDILHPGHLSMLRHARSVCDRLVVGLNSDASVTRLKGEGRPVNDAASRALLLASLEMVDRVVVFEEDTPAELIRAVRPHVLVKGADYVADELPGAAFVRETGGEVVLAPLEEGRSTTGIVEKLRSAKT
ncbi:D-glycero-beta-D-manno-heptose 1-phosphate adenylyltransferase [Marinicauda salina]|uniref:Bifunctional protein HldE n=1 Tax=Marinicauda salina TaxID=2135793 RepID=A0A2U2BVK8_9PROT|nr:D-glycero-beta-D-manno-heptose 1-phosphate adenylyltransferase [Marinicauda salina]PWE18027.1 D-glycero-beta-D-manno-heptose 1-phosphate adenylyltransferase [Marinicauda salina]